MTDKAFISAIIEKAAQREAAGDIDYQSLDENEAALADLNKVIDLAPTLHEAYFRRAQVNKAMLRMEAAIKDLDFLLANSPKHTKKARFERAVAHNVMKNYQAALQDYNVCVQEDEFDAEAWYQRGLLFDEVGQLDKAVEDYSRAIKLVPGDEAFFYSRGHAYFRLNKDDLAIEDLSAAIRLSPKLAELYFWRGFSYERSKKYTEAKQDFSRVIATENDVAVLGESYFHLAFVQTKNAGIANDLLEHSQAITNFTKAIDMLEKSKPDYARSFFWRAHEHEQLSEYPEAVQDYDKAIEVMGPTNPFVPTIMVSRAMVKKKMGNLSQCLAELQQAADLMHISLEELVKQFEIRLDAGVTSPRREPLVRRKSVTFAMAAPETTGRSSLTGVAPTAKKQLRFSDADEKPGGERKKLKDAPPPPQPEKKEKKHKKHKKKENGERKEKKSKKHKKKKKSSDENGEKKEKKHKKSRRKPAAEEAKPAAAVAP